MAELESTELVRRAYDRFGFGATTAQLEAGAKDPERTIAALVSTRSGRTDPGVTATPMPDLAAAERAERADVPDGKRKDLSKEERRALQQGRRERQQRALAWWLTRMTKVERPLPERLTWFWHGHFATSVQKVKRASLMLQQNATLRDRGTATFRPLAQAMIIDPAMLIWLDGNDNVKGAPNENLAREFMELFALGHGSYAETDVREAARALTGWKVRRASGQAVLLDRQHDTDTKTILGRSADYDARSYVDLLCDQPASGAFVVSRLWARLVSTTPPDAAAAKRLATAWGKDGDVGAVLSAITREPAFHDSASSLVKQPVEWAVGLLRALSVDPAAMEPRQRARLAQLLRGMGQVPFLPPSVGGWPSGQAWLTTASALSRTQAAQVITKAAQLGKGSITATAMPEHVRRLLAIDRLSDRTTAAIAEVGGSLPAAVVVAACSPEYVVSR